MSNVANPKNALAILLRDFHDQYHASKHPFAAGCLERRFAVKMKVGPRRWVRYTGQRYTPEVSSCFSVRQAQDSARLAPTLSTSTALQLITGISTNISRGRLSSIQP